MKAERTLKVWSIITISLSMVLLATLFFILFASVSVGAFLVTFYEDFTNEYGVEAHHLYEAAFRYTLFGLAFMIVANQVLMWIRSSILKKNDKNLRKDIDDMKKNKMPKEKKVKKNKKHQEVEVVEETPVVEEVVVVKKTTRQAAAAENFIKKAGKSQ